MLDFTLFWVVFLPALALMIKPGPHLLAFMSMAADGRWKSMAIFWLGTFTAGTFLYFMLLGGLSLLPDNSGLIFIFIKAMGASLFVTMGLRALDNARMIRAEDIAKKKEKISRQSFLQAVSSGFLLSCSNPYVLLFILTGIPAITGIQHYNFWEILSVRLAVMSADILILIAFCAPIMLLRQGLSDAWLKRIRFGSGLAMIGIGLYIFSTVILQWDLLKTSLL